MKRSFVSLISWLVVVLLAPRAMAQPPGVAAPLPAFLETRVPQELAAEGIVLARRDLALQITQVEDRLLVSLVDVTTGRVAASTMITTIPPDREAAVASVTHVAAQLVTQVAGAPEPPAADPAGDERTPDVPQPDAFAVQAARDASERAYRREEIRFGERFELAGTSRYTGTGRPGVAGVVHIHGTRTFGAVAQRHIGWPALRGENDSELDPTEFYDLVGRDDLAETYVRRRRIAIGGGVAAGVAAVISVALVAKAASLPDNDAHCDPYFQPGTTDQYWSCVEVAELARAEEASGYYTPAAVLGGVALVGLVTASLAYYFRHPVTETEAKDLAEDYNARLRRKHGLEARRRAPSPRPSRVTVAPYATGHGGGFAVTGSF